jgi:carbon starvation protein CstA
MSEIEFFTLALILVGTFIVTSADAVYRCARFLMHRQGLRTLISVAVLMAWLVITAIGVGVVYVLLNAHSQRDDVLTMLQAVGIGYPILGIVFIFVLWSLGKRHIPTDSGPR